MSRALDKYNLLSKHAAKLPSGTLASPPKDLETGIAVLREKTFIYPLNEEINADWFNVIWVF